jgi:hypothetical protein
MMIGGLVGTAVTIVSAVLVTVVGALLVGVDVGSVIEWKGMSATAGSTPADAHSLASVFLSCMFGGWVGTGVFRSREAREVPSAPASKTRSAGA